MGRIRCSETKIMRRCFMFCSLILFFSGCTTMKPVALPPHDTEMADAYDTLLEKGDYVTIYSTSGEPISMEVVAVTDERIHGKTRTLSEVAIPIAEIARVERKEVSAENTGEAVAGGTFITIFLFFTLIGPLLLFL